MADELRIDAREKLVELLYRAHHNASCVIDHDGSEEEALKEEARYIIAQGVTVSPMRHGHWIEMDGYELGEHEYLCSECKETEWGESAAKLRYCPFCGARMDDND